MCIAGVSTLSQSHTCSNAQLADSMQLQYSRSIISIWCRGSAAFCVSQGFPTHLTKLRRCRQINLSESRFSAVGDVGAVLGALVGCGVRRELWVVGVRRSNLPIEREIVQRCQTAAAQSGGQLVVYDKRCNVKRQPNNCAFKAPLDFD